MKSNFILRILLLLITIFCSRAGLIAQKIIPPPSNNTDTVRTIQIIQGQSLREKTLDSLTSLQTIAGDVILKEGLTLFYCDSAAINKRTNVLEAFGNVHINQNDSIHTYSQYLKYIGKERVAYLKKEVRLTDNKGTLFTQDLEYDLKSSIGKYFNGGRVVNGKTNLTSTEGIYYAETKDVIFKKNVHLVDPKYDMRNDTLFYNTQTQITSWNTPTKIISKNGGDIYSVNGTYDLKNGKAFFGNRTIIKDSTRTYTANQSAYDEATGIAQLEGNAVIKDSVNGYTVLGGQVYLDKNNNTFLATRKPVLIFKGEGKDSTFIAADTLFSGIEKRDSLGRKIVVSKDTLKRDTVFKARDSLLVNGDKKDSLESKGLVKHSLLKDTGMIHRPDTTFVQKDSLESIGLVKNKPLKDSSMINKADSAFLLKDSTINKSTIQGITAKDSVSNGIKDRLLSRMQNKRDSTNKLITGKEINKPPIRSINAVDSAKNRKTDSLTVKNSLKDSTSEKVISAKQAIEKDSLDDSTLIHVSKDTAIRYFIAFHHVRIFNDSLQSVCDSLYYSSEDSIFRLYQNPLVFSNNSQIAGDTIFMYTKNKKPARLYVFENGIIINKANERMYNQIAGRTLNGYFKDGELNYMRAKGAPAESVYYPQDDDSAYIGMNRSKGDVIDIYFVDKAVNKVKLINDVDATLFPIRQIPEDQKYLKNYKWLDSRRPKNKLELFE